MTVVMHRSGVFAVLFFCASASQILAQRNDYIDLYGVRLRLSSAKSDVLARLSKNADLHPLAQANGSLICVTAREAPSDWSDGCDLLFFGKDDRLAQITKRQGGTTDEMAARMVRNLFTAIRDAESQGIPIVVKALPEEEAPEVRSGTIVFKIGSKLYNLGVLQPVGKSRITSSSVGLGEVLRADSIKE